MKNMIKQLLLLAACLGGLNLFAAPEAVVIPDQACHVERVAAKELAIYLKKSTGREIPVIPESQHPAGRSGYFLGKTRLAAAKKIHAPEPDNSFAVKYDDGSLFIVGRDGSGSENNNANPAGTLFGVYHFLRSNLGIRWIYPGADGEYVPSKPDFAPDKSCDFTYIPRLIDRCLNSTVKDRQVRRFYRRNMFMYKTNAARARGGHNNWIFQQYGKTDPDLFAMAENGTRNCAPNGTFCLSNPKLHEVLFKYAVDRKRPFLSGHEADNVKRCQCPSCLKLDGSDWRGPTGRYSIYKNMGERYARWYKMLLKKGQEADPALKVSAYAYQSFFYAPRETKLSPDVHIGLVPDIPFPRRVEHNEFLRKEYQAWKAAGVTLYLRPNYFSGGYSMPEVWYDEYADELKYLCALGITGVVDGGMRNMWATRGPDMYVASRLSIDPDADAEKLFEEYISAFGAAAPAVREYFKFFQKYLKDNCARINDIYEKSYRLWYFHGFDYPVYAHKIFPPAVLGSQTKTLDKAAELAKNDPAALKKVRFIQAGLRNAIASAKCAAIFDSKASGTAKAKAWKNLRSMRKKLPRHAVNVPYCDNLEKRHWRYASVPRLAGTFIELPEHLPVMPDPQNVGEKEGWYQIDFADADWKTVSTWKGLDDSGYRNYHWAFYRYKFTLPESEGKRCILRLGAIDKDCKVWVNGRFAGESRFETNPARYGMAVQFDITDFVASRNVLAVKIDNHGGRYGGIWKPSYIFFETPARSEAVPVKFQIPAFVRQSKTAGFATMTLTGRAKPARMLMLNGELPLPLAPGEKVRVRGEINISGLAGAQVDISLRQHDKQGGKVKFDDLIYRADTDRWEDFSFEAEIKPGTSQVKLVLIGRKLPEKCLVSFRNIRLEKL
ncbi:MAG: DUF4838 domain-containing protein [Lentisphaeria bacterium]|nr:DUF4838 domain-containing protein [Lentisphaeria bacterium]